MRDIIQEIDKLELQFDQYARVRHVVQNLRQSTEHIGFHFVADFGTAQAHVNIPIISALPS